MKLKIQIEIDVDVKEIFSRIPEGLFKGPSDMVTEQDEREYLIESIGHVLNNGYTQSLMNKMDSIIEHPDTCTYSEHHYEVEIEIGKQLSHFKIIE